MKDEREFLVLGAEGATWDMVNVNIILYYRMSNSLCTKLLCFWGAYVAACVVSEPGYRWGFFGASVHTLWNACEFISLHYESFMANLLAQCASAEHVVYCV